MSVYTNDQGFDVVDVDGIPRILNKLPPDPAKRRTFASFASTGQLVPESDWVEIDRRAQMPFILDQKNHGSCVGFSSAGNLMAALTAMGDAPPKLSGSFIYGHINGGRDNGAQITDALAVLRDIGTCTDAECGWDTIYKRSFTQGMYDTAKKYRLLEAYTADTWEEVMSAIQLGFFPDFAVQVGSTFMHLDGNGVSGFDRGSGNHAVRGIGARKVGGQWVIDMPNSWGTSFGRNGFTYLTQRHIEGVQQDCYVVRAAVGSPDDPNQPPAVPT